MLYVGIIYWKTIFFLTIGINWKNIPKIDTTDPHGLRNFLSQQLQDWLNKLGSLRCPIFLYSWEAAQPNFTSSINGRKRITTKGSKKQKTPPPPPHPPLVREMVEMKFKEKDRYIKIIYLGKESMMEIVQDSFYILCSQPCRYGNTLLVTEGNLFY